MKNISGIPAFAFNWPWFMTPIAYSINSATGVRTIQHELAELAINHEIWRHGQ